MASGGDFQHHTALVAPAPTRDETLLVEVLDRAAHGRNVHAQLGSEFRDLQRAKIRQAGEHHVRGTAQFDPGFAAQVLIEGGQLGAPDELHPGVLKLDNRFMSRHAQDRSKDYLLAATIQFQWVAERRSL